jgi:hypothetical protein
MSSIRFVKIGDEDRERQDHEAGDNDPSLRPDFFTRWKCNIMTKQEYQSINLVRDVKES